jgi:hypothetical protein
MRHTASCVHRYVLQVRLAQLEGEVAHKRALLAESEAEVSSK